MAQLLLSGDKGLSNFLIIVHLYVQANFVASLHTIPCPVILLVCMYITI